MTTKTGSGKKKASPESEPHKKYPSGSQFYALSNCDASFELSQASGEEPPTEFSDRGNDVHGVINGKIKPEDVEEEIVEEAKLLSGLRKLDLERWLDPDLPFTEITERRLWLRKGMRPYYSGQPDIYVVQGRRVFLSDFKTGWHPLDHFVATNCQIRAYVPLIDADLRGAVDEITAAIHKPGKQSPQAVFNREAIQASTEWAISVAITAVAKGQKTPNRGPWCKYCSGKVLCPLWQKEIATLSELSTAIVTDIPDSALREMAPSLALAKMVAEKLLERLYARVQSSPEFFRDWKFRPADPRRKIDDVIDAYNALVVKAKALSPGEFLFTCRLGITELEKQVRRSQGLSVKQTRLFLEEKLAGIMEYRQGKPELVYDPRSNGQPELPQ